MLIKLRLNKTINYVWISYKRRFLLNTRHWRLHHELELTAFFDLITECLHEMSKSYIKYIICTSSIRSPLHVSWFFQFRFYCNYFLFPVLFSSIESSQSSSGMYSTYDWYSILLVSVNISNIHHINSSDSYVS